MELARGVRDFPPEVQIIREDLFRKIRKAFERHGFSPFASPAIERIETLTAKFTGDEDVMKELFRLRDQGGRELGLRFDLTVPLARFVAMNKDLKLPFKRYEIGRVYRDGPIKLGRYREFWQCDADIVGSSSMLADAECVKVASDILATLPFEYEIRVNSRKLLEAVFEHVGIADRRRAMIVIDKLDKQGETKVRQELQELTDKRQIDALFDILLCQGTDNGKLKHIEERVGPHEGIAELRELLAYLSDLAHVHFDPTLARGLNYYTGTVYEAFLKGSDVTSAVGGGGRYDGLIGQLADARDSLPAVGISIGVEPLTDALLAEKHRFDRTTTRVFVIPIQTEREATRIADKLRARGISTDIDVMGRSLSKNLDYANRLGIPFAVIVGPKDVQKGVVTLKNMRSGEEAHVPFEELDKLDLDAYA